MSDFQIIAELDDLSRVRVITAALKAHGFHPLEGGENGLPGMPGVIGPRGIAIQVPGEEATDAGVLVAALLEDMR